MAEAREENITRASQYTDSTTRLAYELGQTKFAVDHDISTKKIDHLISSYTGIFGQVNKALFPMNKNLTDTTLGLRNKFVSDSNYSTDVLNKVYDNRDAAKRDFTYYGTIEKAVEYEKNAVVASYISNMNKAIKALPYDKQRNDRILLLKDLNNWEYENTKSDYLTLVENYRSSPKNMSAPPPMSLNICVHFILQFRPFIFLFIFLDFCFIQCYNVI